MTGRLRFFLFLVSTTILPVIGGIAFMVASIGLTWWLLLPKIYICPIGATCPGSLDPTTSRYFRLTRLQTVMHYLMVAGTAIAAFGLSKLTAYQSWLTMRHGKYSLKTLQRHLDAICLQFWSSTKLFRAGTPRLLAGFILFQIVMSQLIQTIVTLSISKISRIPGSVMLEFSYSNRFSVPAVSEIHFNDTRYRTAHRKAGNKVEEWLFSKDSTYGRGPNGLQFRGSFVVPDNRTSYAVNSYPEGYRITGTVSCTNESLSITSTNITSPTSAFNFTVPLPPSDSRLSAYLVSITWYSDSSNPTYSGTTARYLWASQASGFVPDAIVFGDTSYSLCTHDVGMHNISVAEKKESEGKQIIRASNPYTQVSQHLGSTTDFEGTIQSILFSLGYLIDTWWSTQGNSYWRRISCQQGLLTPLDDTGSPCQVNSQTWTPTVRAMMDAVVQTGATTGIVTQWLDAHRESINPKQWWLQTIIPFTTLLVYISSLGYTMYLIQPGENEVMEQSLTEILKDRKLELESAEIDGAEEMSAPLISLARLR